MCLITLLRAPSRRERFRRCATSATFYGRSSMRSISRMSSRDGRRRGRFRSAWRRSVAELTEASVPRFAVGCRWGGTTEAPVVLFPEGAIRADVLTFLEQLHAKRVIDF